MILNWFDAADAMAFGRALATAYLQTPAPSTSRSAKKQAKANVAHAKHLEHMVQQFKREHALNVYKKAKLANVFKWSLLDAGTDPKIADAVTRDIVLLLR